MLLMLILKFNFMTDALTAQVHRSQAELWKKQEKNEQDSDQKSKGPASIRARLAEDKRGEVTEGGTFTVTPF